MCIRDSHIRANDGNTLFERAPPLPPTPIWHQFLEFEHALQDEDMDPEITGEDVGKIAAEEARGREWPEAGGLLVSILLQIVLASPASKSSIFPTTNIDLTLRRFSENILRFALNDQQDEGYPWISKTTPKSASFVCGQFSNSFRHFGRFWSKQRNK